MACQKVCKQGRDDIIVKVTKHYPYNFFNTTVVFQYEKDAGSYEALYIYLH